MVNVVPSYGRVLRAAPNVAKSSQNINFLLEKLSVGRWRGVGGKEVEVEVEGGVEEGMEGWWKGGEGGGGGEV